MPFDFQQYTALVKQVTIGKKLPDSIYTHRSALDCYPQALLQLVTAVATNLKLDNEWHIVKLYRRDFKLAFLYYPTFDDYAYPALNKSITVDLSQLSHRVANYGTSKIHRFSIVKNALLKVHTLNTQNLRRSQQKAKLPVFTKIPGK